MATDPLEHKLSNSTHRSRTDPDATLAYKAGTARALKYKVHNSIDADSRVILQTAVTTGACHESQVFLSHLQELAARYPVEEVIADRAYGTTAIIQAVSAQGITPYIPLFSGMSGSSANHIPPGFTYEAEEDRFRCPAGCYLTPFSSVYSGRARYRSAARDCAHCSLAASCTAFTRKGTKSRYLYRNLLQPFFEQVKARMVMPEFIQRLTERMWKIEGIFAEAKNCHTLSRARYRGRRKCKSRRI